MAQPAICVVCNQLENLTRDSHGNLFTDFAKHAPVHMDCIGAYYSCSLQVSCPFCKCHLAEMGSEEQMARHLLACSLAEICVGGKQHNLALRIEAAFRNRMTSSSD